MNQENPLSLALVALFKGIVYREDQPELWRALMEQQTAIRDYVRVLGLTLELDEAEGYAWLKQGDEGENLLPRLVPRHRLSYPVSLILALLRKRLAEMDAGGQGTRLILSRDEILKMVEVFFDRGTNEARFVDLIDAHLSKIVDLGFIRRLKNNERQFEVNRIVKAFIDAQWLADFDKKLSEYKNTDEMTPGAEAEE